MNGKQHLVSGVSTSIIGYTGVQFMRYCGQSVYEQLSVLSKVEELVTHVFAPSSLLELLVCFCAYYAGLLMQDADCPTMWAEELHPEMH